MIEIMIRWINSRVIKDSFCLLKNIIFRYIDDDVCNTRSDENDDSNIYVSI